MTESFNAHFDDDPAAYDALRAGWMATRRVQQFVGFLESAPAGATVCEIGCGTGAMLLALAGARPDLRFVGVEPIEAYVDYAVARIAESGLSNLDVARGTARDLERLGIADVDYWCSSDVLHHVPDEGAAVDAVTASSSDGARWLLVEPNAFNAYVGAYQALADGERNFRPRRFAREALARGWRTAERRYVFLVPARFAEPPAILRRLEPRLEGLRLVGGAVALTLRLEK